MLVNDGEGFIRIDRNRKEGLCFYDNFAMATDAGLKEICDFSIIYYILILYLPLYLPPLV